MLSVELGASAVETGGRPAIESLGTEARGGNERALARFNIQHSTLNILKTIQHLKKKPGEGNFFLPGS